MCSEAAGFVTLDLLNTLLYCLLSLSAVCEFTRNVWTSSRNYTWMKSSKNEQSATDRYIRVSLILANFTEVTCRVGTSSSSSVACPYIVERCCRHKVPPVSTILCSPPRGVQTNVGRFQIIFNSSSPRLSWSPSRSFPVSRRSSNCEYRTWGGFCPSGV